jgi:hypothetical protein
VTQSHDNAGEWAYRFKMFQLYAASEVGRLADDAEGAVSVIESLDVPPTAFWGDWRKASMETLREETGEVSLRERKSHRRGRWWPTLGLGAVVCGIYAWLLHPLSPGEWVGFAAIASLVAWAHADATWIRPTKWGPKW